MNLLFSFFLSFFLLTLIISFAFSIYASICTYLSTRIIHTFLNLTHVFSDTIQICMGLISTDIRTFLFFFFGYILSVIFRSVVLLFIVVWLLIKQDVQETFPGWIISMPTWSPSSAIYFTGGVCFLDIYVQAHVSVSAHSSFVTILKACPVGWGCRIHRLLLCRGVRPPHNECPGFDTKQSDGEAPAMLELWGMRSTPSLQLLPGPLWPGVVAPDKDPIYGLNRINSILMLKRIVWVKLNSLK